MSRSREPKQLARGKRFHKQIQEEWLATRGDGKPDPERFIKRVNGSHGRIDILVEELGDDLVAVIEIKATDWDKIQQKNLKRNIRRQVRQVWSYIDSQIDIYDKEVCPGILFPKKPKDKERLELIESIFNEEGIQVAWQDESIEELKARIGKG